MNKIQEITKNHGGEFVALTEKFFQGMLAIRSAESHLTEISESKIDETFDSFTSLLGIEEDRDLEPSEEDETDFEEQFGNIQELQQMSDEVSKKEFEDELKGSLEDVFDVPAETGLRGLMTGIEEMGKYTLIQTEVRNSLLVNLKAKLEEIFVEVLRSFYRTNPKRLKESDISISAKDTLEVEGKDELREYFIEKEVINLTKKNHMDQVEHLENLLNTSLGTNDRLDLIHNYIEITARRDLIVHNGSKINSVYISRIQNLDETHIELPSDLKIGSSITVDEDYFLIAWRAILEFGFNIIQVSWRRIKEDQIELADYFLTHAAYKLLKEDYLKSALSILNSGLNNFDDMPDTRITLVINKALIHKMLGQTEEMNRIMSDEDFEHLRPIYRLAEDSLNEEFEKAVEKFERAVLNDELLQHQVDVWPLFEEFKNTEAFRESYEKLFGEEYTEERPSLYEKM